MMSGLQSLSHLPDVNTFCGTALVLLAVVMILGLMLCIGITVFAGRLVDKRIREEKEKNDENGE